MSEYDETRRYNEGVIRLLLACAHAVTVNEIAIKEKMPAEVRKVTRARQQQAIGAVCQVLMPDAFEPELPQ